MADHERIITPEVRVLSDPRGIERVSRSDGGKNPILFGRVAFFGEESSVNFIEQQEVDEVRNEGE